METALSSTFVLLDTSKLKPEDDATIDQHAVKTLREDFAATAMSEEGLSIEQASPIHGRW